MGDGRFELVQGGGSECELELESQAGEPTSSATVD